MITCVGVSYLVMTEFHYPAALAFSFLNELMREFIQLYDSNKVNTARRPYQFIEFGNFLFYLVINIVFKIKTNHFFFSCNFR